MILLTRRYNNWGWEVILQTQLLFGFVIEWDIRYFSVHLGPLELWIYVKP